MVRPSLEVLYQQHIEIINLLNQHYKEIINRFNELAKKLEEIHEGIKTLSDNQVVLDEKLEGIKDVVKELRAVLPGV
ncbi:hypothetical protein DRO97_10635 [Archaeoglobales archaeon]|nr:MAG: hypothetical protein DRO97_10635 [Archaeoglobales archaeon]